MKATKQIILLSILFIHGICSNLSGQNLYQIIAPQPIYPGNGDMVKEKMPSFAWSPSSGNVKNYIFKLVEILADQTPEASILSNPILFEANNLTNILPYPAYATLLERGKKYAWQVTTEATVYAGEKSNDIVLPGEVFWFYLAPLVEEKCLPLLSSSVEKKFYVIDNYALKFGFQENSLLTRKDFFYQILESGTNSVQISNISPEWSNDSSCWTIPLKEYSIFRKSSTKNKFYLLKAISPTGENYMLKFTCQ